MGVMDEASVIEPGSASDWGQWLRENHAMVRGVWVCVPDRRAVGAEVLSYENAVREALCWGWIDGRARSGGGGALTIWFAPRRVGSPWAASNRARIELLESEGRLQPAGRALVDAAMADGSWVVLIGPENGEEPPALTQVATAKRETTRDQRIARIVEQCSAGLRPDR